MIIEEEAKARETLSTLTPSPRCTRQTTTLWALLVWTYARQKAHLSAEASVCGYGAISPTGAVLERLRLGTAVDCSRRGFPGLGGASGGACDADAMTVHGLVLRLGRHARLVIETASAQAMPEWQPGYPPARVSPVLNGRGKPKMIYDENRNEVACHLRVEGFDPDRAREWVEYHRQRYTQWWAALSVLHRMVLEGGPLMRWRVTGIGADARPWCTDGQRRELGA